jgi:hypothetical protein
VLPAYWHAYKLTTKPVSNALGNWFGLEQTDLGIVSKEEYRMADMFWSAIARGEKRAETQVIDDSVPF